MPTAARDGDSDIGTSCSVGGGRPPWPRNALITCGNGRDGKVSAGTLGYPQRGPQGVAREAITLLSGDLHHVRRGPDMTLRRALVITAVSALALGLAACEGGADEPSPSSTAATTTASPTEPTTASATTSQPAVAAPDPSAYPGMDEQTEEGAKQAFKYFFAALIYGYQTGDSKPLSSISAADCEYCNDAIEALTDLQDAGQTWGSTQIADRYLSVEQEIPQGYVVGYGYEVSEHLEPGATPNSTTSEPSAIYGAAGELVWENDSWRVGYVENKKQ